VQLRLNDLEMTKMMIPSTEAELSHIIAEAKVPLAIQGGGTRGVSLNGDALGTSGLSGIELYEPGALTIVVKAGTPVAEVDAALATERQRIAFEPMDHRGLLGTTGTPTMGGLVAANVSGPRRIQAGAARDFALGVRFVDGRGEIIKNGGRVMKNVTGYDLVKLMSGSHGSLGVLSEVSLKVLPMPETEATLLVHGLDNDHAVQAMAAALGSPFDVTGAAHDPDASVTLIRVEGFEASVAYRIEKLREALARFGAEMSVSEASSNAWQGVRDVTAFHGRVGDVWRVSVKPSDGPKIVATSGAEAALFDWAGGLVWLLTEPDADLRARLGLFNGHATLIRGSSQPRFHPEDAGIATLSAGLRQRFDPRGILNAGLMGS
jgi:glycolate oxidase FAD binding subunit